MIQFRRNLAHVVAIAIVLLLTGCAQTTIRQHPSFADATRKVERIAILPPQVTHTLVQFDGKGPRNPAKEAAIGKEIVRSLKAALEQRGYTVTTELVDAVNGGDQALSFEFEQLKTAYQQGTKELYATPAVAEADANKFKVSLGATGNTFALMSGADALMLVHFDGIEKSSGQVAKEVVASALLSVFTGVVMIPAAEAGSAELALIDGVTGDVLWSNRGGSPGVGSAVALNVLHAFPKREIVSGEDTVVAASPKEGEVAPVADLGDMEPGPVALTADMGARETQAEVVK